jgi:hypothetical protein
MSTFDTYVYVLTNDGEEHEVKVRIDYDAVYQAEYTSGLPENCYQAESEMTLNSVEAINELPEGITDADVSMASHDADERLQDEAWEHYHSNGVDDGPA